MSEDITDSRKGDALTSTDNDDIATEKKELDDRMLLNVGGVRHETHVSTLRNVPNTRLSRLAEAHIEAEREREEYFFDRHPAVFNSIIDFYRTGKF